MPKRNTKLQDALDAIDEVFGDTSVSKHATLEAMEEIRDAAVMNIEALRADIKAEEGE